MPAQPFLEPRTAPLELLVDRRIAQAPQHRQPRGGGERIPRQRARLVDGACGREEIHDLRPAAEGRERQAAADDLAEDRQIRLHAEPLLCAAARDPEPADHLVEHEQRARRVAQRT